MIGYFWPEWLTAINLLKQFGSFTGLYKVRIMKKLDFHIHTISSSSDSDFEFSADKLKEYIETSRLDCIAITNHNLFQKEQFENIIVEIAIPAFPGIEIDLEGGQILVIGDGTDLDDFDGKCAKISSSCSDQPPLTGPV